MSPALGPLLASTLLVVAVLWINGSMAIFVKVLKCRQEECDIPSEHFNLYSRAKQAIDSEFNFKNGKEFTAFVSAIRILDQRYNDVDDAESIPGYSVVKEKVLSRPEFARAQMILRSDDAQTLSDLYGVKMNDKKYTTACASERISRIQRAEKLLNQNQDMRWMFEKLHKSFVSRSALKCLKHSCHSVDKAMTIIDPDTKKWSAESPFEGTISREYKKQELALCQFVTGTNDPYCKINATELINFKMINAKQMDTLLKAYVRNLKRDDSQQDDPFEASKVHILGQCHTMERSLDEALSGLKYFWAQKLVSDLQVSSKREFCPELSYWMEVDRICEELASSFAGNLPTESPTTTTTSTDRLASSSDKVESNEI